MPMNTLDMISRWSRKGGTNAQKTSWSIIQAAYGGVSGRKGIQDILRTKATLLQKIRLNCILLLHFGVNKNI